MPDTGVEDVSSHITTVRSLGPEHRVLLQEQNDHRSSSPVAGIARARAFLPKRNPQSDHSIPCLASLIRSARIGIQMTNSHVSRFSTLTYGGNAGNLGLVWLAAWRPISLTSRTSRAALAPILPCALLAIEVWGAG